MNPFKIASHSSAFQNEERLQFRIPMSGIWIMVLLFGLALAVRAIRLFDLDLWIDETLLLRHVEGSFRDTWFSCQIDNHPPLFPWLLKLWLMIFPGDHAARFFVALCGALVPPAAYLLGVQLDGKKLGFMVGLACIVSPAFLFYSQMIRMYSILPFFVCLSLVGFLRALKTNDWKDWLLTAVSNLAGFYTYIFAVFIPLAQVFVLIMFKQHRTLRLRRFALLHLPVLLLMLLWLGPLWSRFQRLQNVFWLPPVSYREIGQTWIFFGTGYDFDNHFVVAALLNVPFAIGLLLGFKRSGKSEAYWAGLGILCFIPATVLGVSLLGQSFFFKRYLIFLIPLYLSLVFLGWMGIGSRWRRLGLWAIAGILILSSLYYYVDYYKIHDMAPFSLSRSANIPDEGHAISRNAEAIRQMLLPNEVLIHYSGMPYVVYSFFPSCYYNRRNIPEYIYSGQYIPDFHGGQYLKPGECIQNLDELRPVPDGIWVICMGTPEGLFNPKRLEQPVAPWRWVRSADLPRDLFLHGYVACDTLRFGGLTTLHFRKIR